jgi:glycosyltransferase involved in cell wall biosynthesis
LKVIQVHNRYRYLSGEDMMFERTVRLLRCKGQTVYTFERDSQIVQGAWRKIQAFQESIYSRSTKKNLGSLIGMESPDLVHFHNVYPLISPSIMITCKEHRVPVVMHCHQLRLLCPNGTPIRKGLRCELCFGGREYWCALTNCRNNVFESIGYALRNATARKLRLFEGHVTCFVSPSEFLKNRLISAGFPPDRIFVVPNMASLHNTSKDFTRGDYVAYAGNVRPEKGIEVLLSATEVTGLPLRLAADYSARPEILKKAPQNALFVGHLDREKLSEFYQNARFIVVPSISDEIFPLVALEAMSHGLPVIASRIGGLPEIVENENNGLLFEAGNVEELSSKMKLLWDNPSLCRQMGKAGFEKSIREYSEDAYYERLMSVYDKAVNLNKCRS